MAPRRVKSSQPTLGDCDVVDGILEEAEVLGCMSMVADGANITVHTVSLNLFPRPYSRGHIRSSRKATRKRLICKQRVSYIIAAVWG